MKRVDLGASISIWNDPWIPSLFSRQALSNGSSQDPLLRVKNIIDYRSNTWKMEQLIAKFETKDISMICVMPLGARTKPASLGWHLTK